MQIVLKSFNEAPFVLLESVIGLAACEFLKSENERIVFVALHADSVDVYHTEKTEGMFELNPRPSNVGIHPAEMKLQLRCSSLVMNLTNAHKSITPLVVVFPLDNSTFKLVLSEKSHADLFLIEQVAKTHAFKHHIIINSHAILKSAWLCSAQTTPNTAVMQNEDTAALVEREVEIREHGVFYDQHVFVPKSQVNVRSHIKLNGEFAKSLSAGCLFTEAGQIYYEPIQEHFARHTQSALNFKVVLAKHAKSFFRGLVILHRNAQKSEAQQENKNLLLSRTARADSEPRLEIEPNDVLCKHGSATAEIDKQQLYYLMSRGFSNQDAKTLIVKSFCHSPLSVLENDSSFLTALMSLTLDYTFDTHVSALKP